MDYKMEAIEKMTKDELKDLARYVITTETVCDECSAGTYCYETNGWNCVETYVNWWRKEGGRE